MRGVGLRAQIVNVYTTICSPESSSQFSWALQLGTGFVCFFNCSVDITSVIPYQMCSVYRGRKAELLNKVPLLYSLLQESATFGTRPTREICW